MPDIEKIKKEYDSLVQQLSDPGLISDWEKFEELSKQKGNLEKIINKDKEIEELEVKIEENKLIGSAPEDKELASLAEAENNQLQEKKTCLEKELEKLLSGGEEKNENQAVIVEIRAGTGGEEAALFVGDLFQMYSKYTQSQDWLQKTLDSHQTELGGFKEIIFEVKGNNAFNKMKYEAGVHRVQRIPTTEKSGRIHTSTVSVAVLLKPKRTEIKIRPDDLRIDVYKSSGPGGQYVNKRETAIRITHLPTGLVVTSQTERNLLQNRENAMAILEARLLEKQQTEDEKKFSDKRKTQIGWAKRAEKIRTYNFPQDRITDHRIPKNWHNIEQAMEGKLDEIIEDLESSFEKSANSQDP